MSKLRAVLCIALAMLVLVPGAALAAKKDGAKAAPAKKEAPAAPAAAAAAEVTLKGTMTCGKCSLKQADACQNVLKVDEKGKEVPYWLEANDVAKANHGPVCSGSKAATVTGTLSEAGGKKMLTARTIQYAE